MALTMQATSISKCCHVAVQQSHGYNPAMDHQCSYLLSMLCMLAVLLTYMQMQSCAYRLQEVFT